MKQVKLLSKSPLCLSVDMNTSIFDAGVAYAQKRKMDGGVGAAKLSEVATLRATTINPTSSLHKDTSFQYIDLAEVDEVLGSIMTYRELLGVEIGSSKVRFKKGDILFAKIRPSIDNKKVAYVYQELENAVASTEFIVLTAKNSIETLYLYAAMRSDEFTEAVKGACGGDTGRQRIKPSQLLDLEIPWPEEDVRESISSCFAEFFKKLNEAAELRQQAVQTGADVLGATNLRTAQPRRKRTRIKSS